MFCTQFAKFLLPFFVVGYWVLGFYPFHWFSPFTIYENAVEKTADGGFSFRQPGIAHTGSAPSWVKAAIKDNAFEVKLEVLSYNAHQTGPARIFTLSLDHQTRNFTIGQSNADLVVRLRTSATGPNGTPEYLVRQVFGDSAIHRVAVRVQPEEIRIEVDGRQRLIAALPSDALSTWDAGHWLALGNEFTFQRPWRGEIREAIVRVHGAKFDYAAANLRMPNTYQMGTQAFSNELLGAVSISLEHASLRDRVVNFVGFAPLGLLLSFVGQKLRSPATTFAWCGLLSLSIETGQLFLEARVASTVDVLLNAAGGCVGAWIGSRLQFAS
ncbi:MAG: VanZ family protein [Gammaproteobacteria bacterium]